MYFATCRLVFMSSWFNRYPDCINVIVFMLHEFRLHHCIPQVLRVLRPVPVLVPVPVPVVPVSAVPVPVVPVSAVPVPVVPGLLRGLEGELLDGELRLRLRVR
jgi:hypothetical protein